MCQKPAVKFSRCHVGFGLPVRDPDCSRASATAAAGIFSRRVVDAAVLHHLQCAAPAVCTQPDWQPRAFITSLSSTLHYVLPAQQLQRLYQSKLPPADLLIPQETGFYKNTRSCRGGHVPPHVFICVFVIVHQQILLAK